MMKPHNFIISLFDLSNNNLQKYTCSLITHWDIHDVSSKFGLSPTLKHLMGRRWLININEVLNLNISWTSVEVQYTTSAIIKQIIEKLGNIIGV